MLIDTQPFHGTILVTIAYFALWYYLLLYLQTKVKKELFQQHRKAKTKFDRYFGQDKEMLWVDRVVINTQEQMLPFLVSLWFFAILVSPSIACYLGAAYVVLRSIYPVLFKQRVLSDGKPKHYLVTIPCYLIIVSMFSASAYTVLTQ